MHCFRIPEDESFEELLLSMKLAGISSKLNTVTASITTSRRSENGANCDSTRGRLKLEVLLDVWYEVM
jgi:hypothetical protein